MSLQTITLLTRVLGAKNRLLAVSTALETCFNDDNIVAQGCLDILYDIADDLEVLEGVVKEVSEIPAVANISEELKVA